MAAGVLFGHVDWHQWLAVPGAADTGVSFLAPAVRFSAAEAAGDTVVPAAQPVRLEEAD